MKNKLSISIICGLFLSASAQTSGSGGAQNSPGVTLSALIVVAHPDDESCFSATVYQITHNLHGNVDQFIITNGEGGFRYSLLAEPFYGLQLTTEAVGRASLPEIRKREVLSAGKILGIRNHFFLDQRDVRFTQDIQEVLDQHWQFTVVLGQLKRRLEEGTYDYVLTLFPTSDAHGAHKAATLAAYQAIRSMNRPKPVLLACQLSSAGEAVPLLWAPSLGNAEVKLLPVQYKVSRLTKFGFKNLLDYQVIANWVIAEHKSQGAFQKDMDKYDSEEFAVVDTGTQYAARRVASLFGALSQSVSPVTATPATKGHSEPRVTRNQPLPVGGQVESSRARCRLWIQSIGDENETHLCASGDAFALQR
jgi:LmbE family N-acetylglucosaminyl deacetylase